MTSLAETYERQAGEVGRRRIFLGTALFAAGALLVVLGILTGTTTLLSGLGFSVYEARELAGILAGLGVPAVFVGVFTVLPASRQQRAAAAIGASVAVLGVLLFRYAYPGRWYAGGGTPSTLTLGVVVVYFLGTITTFWCLFTAVATFKTRNDPGGTVTLTYQRGGETHTVTVAADDAEQARAALGGSGGVGVFGGLDDPDRGAAASDGGAATDLSSPADDDGEVLRDEEPAESPVDRYCGNCAHFDYVRTDDGIERYCGLHDELMDDMDACERWESNSGPDVR